MCESNHTFVDSTDFSLSQFQSNSFTNISKSSHSANDVLELSHPPLSQFDDDFSPINSLNEVTSFDEENYEEDISDLPTHSSELSLETSPSLRSVHLPTNHKVSSLNYGMQLIHSLSLSPKKPITSSVYSERAQKFVILDHAGIIAWYPESNQSERVYFYPPYKHNLFLEVSFSIKYNVYFVLTKARHIITFNSHFVQVNSTRCFENSLLHLLFLETKSTLIGAGVNGVSFWTYRRINLKNIGQKIRSLKPTEDYVLCPSGLTKIPENKLIRKTTISHEKKWIFALSFYDVYVISFEGKLIKSFLDLHKQTITDCIYNCHYSFLLTVSTDSTLTLWSDSGFPLHVFNSAMKSNTAVIQHPLSPHLVIVSTVKGFIKCYNLFTLEEEFTQCIMDHPILKIDCFEMSKRNIFYAIGTEGISLFDLNYFCEFWSPLRNSLTSVCFYRDGQKSERFHALCRDGTIRIYSIASSRPLSVILPPPDIAFPNSAGSVAYDRNSNLLYILLAPQEIWVYTAKTNPACRLEVYSSDVLSSILSPRDQETGNFVATGISSHNSIPHCTCLNVLPSAVRFTRQDGSQCSNGSNLLMIGLKDGRILFVTTNQTFSKLFEMQASIGEVTSLQVLESKQILSQSVSVAGFIIKIWSLPDLKLEHSLELHNSLVMYWKVQDILLVGFSDGTLSLSPLRGMGSSFGDGSDVEERDETDEIVSIHGIDRFNLFCTAQRSGAVKIWDHHKNLVKVISLNAPLNGAYFLNNNGDLLVSFNQHFYLIKQEYVISSVSLIQAADPDHVNGSLLNDSAIFEDPNCKNGQLVASKEGFYYVDTMESYLKPYDIDLHGPNGLAILDQLIEDNLQNSAVSSLSGSSTDNLVALTSQVYLSDTQTPLVLSFEHFPLPIFSTPTASPRASPPPSEIDEKEMVRDQIKSLTQNKIIDLPTTTQTAHVIEKREIEQTASSSNNNVINISEVEEPAPLLKVVVPKFDTKMTVQRLRKLDTPKKSNITDLPDLPKHETKPESSLSSVEIPTNRIVKTRVLGKRRAERDTSSENSEIIATMAGVNFIPPEAETPDETVCHISPIGESNQGMVIKEVNLRGVPRRRISSLGSTDKQVPHCDSDETKEICNKIVENSLQEIVHSVRSGTPSTPSKENQKVAESKNSTNKVFALNKCVDFSAGWHEREYVRRLGYRAKQYERFAKAWTHQANLQAKLRINKAKFEDKSEVNLHQYPILTFSECNNLMKDREGPLQNQSRCSTPFLSSPIHPPSTPISATGCAHSSSSFYAYKLNLDAQTNFRLGSKRVLEIGVRVPPNSRCTSAPLITTPQHRDYF